MKYHQLKHILNAIKHNTRCPQCTKMYPLDEVDLIDLFENEGVIDFFCPTCKLGMSLNIQLEEFHPGNAEEVVSRFTKSEISDGEVQNFSLLLKNHRGGLEDLFKPVE